eukprot:jgi/Tetstr1/426829/TSEL_017044.t1
MPGAQAADEEELELNYEENDNAMEVDTTQGAAAKTPAAKLASLTAESHQPRNPQRFSIQLERHPIQPTPTGKGKAATTTKHKKKQPRGRSRSDGATRNRSINKPRLFGTRGSDNEWETDDDAAHPSSSSHHGTVFALHKDDSAASEERAKSGDSLRVRPLGVGSVLVRLDSAHALVHVAANVAGYIAWQGLRESVKATSLQPYLSAINGLYRDHGAEPVAQGDLINKFTAVSAECQQPGAATAAYAIGVVLRKIKNFGGWAQLSSVVLDYINPTEPPCAASWKLFG